VRLVDVSRDATDDDAPEEGAFAQWKVGLMRLLRLRKAPNHNEGRLSFVNLSSGA
jgi:pimeloyl-CoA synthetase